MSVIIDGTDGVSKVSDDAITDQGLYDKENILGVVSESAGVPTGAIIESGSNANGEYVKYADGTMILRGMYRAQGRPLNVGGAENAVLTLPHPLSTDNGGTYGIGMGLGRGGFTSIGECYCGGLTTTTVTVYKTGAAGVDSGDIIVTGRWF